MHCLLLPAYSALDYPVFLVAGALYRSLFLSVSLSVSHSLIKKCNLSSVLWDLPYYVCDKTEFVDVTDWYSFAREKSYYMCLDLRRYLPDFGTVVRVRRVFKCVLTYDGIYLTLVQFCA